MKIIKQDEYFVLKIPVIAISPDTIYFFRSNFKIYYYVKFGDFRTKNVFNIIKLLNNIDNNYITIADSLVNDILDMRMSYINSKIYNRNLGYYEL